MDEDSNNKDADPKPSGLQIVQGIFGSNDVFEVEKIIAGPSRRREHLGKMCFKVRWKGYGPEEDTWQPKADLVYVQDLIDEYLKQKSEQYKIKKRKMLEVKSEEANSKENGEELKKERLVDINDDEEKKAEWHPDYGYMKDTFWKDLELGRIKLEGDMYSKVKGSRRAAHAEAMANIQKQQQQQTEKAQTQPKTSSPPNKQKTLSKNGGKKKIVRQGASPSPTKISPKIAAAKAKKRANPFSAKGYTSTKRRKKVVQVAVLQDTTVPSFMSDTTSAGSLDDVKMNGYVTGELSSPELVRQEHDEDMTDFLQTHTVEPSYSISSLDISISFPGVDELEVFKLEGDFQTPNMNGDDIEVKQVKGSDNVCEPKLETESIPSIQESAPVDSKQDCCQRSTMDLQAESMLSVERTHDEECLWGGACNRSDCKANRRWNNKDGKSGDVDEVKKPSASSQSSQSSSSTSSSSTSNSTSSSSLAVETPRMQRDSSASSRNLSSTSSTHPLVFSPSPSKASTTPIKSASSPSNYVDLTQGPLSSRSYSSDSSFDDSVFPGFNKDAVSDTFAHKDRAACQSSIPKSKVDSCKSSNSSKHSERPGLFSDGFFLVDNSSKNTAGVSSQNSSPGKENSGNSSSHIVPLNVSSHTARAERPADVSTDNQTVSSSSSSLGSQSSKSRTHENLVARKRIGELSHPLEKIPSPNSIKEMDLDKRISTLTCEELEDFPEQGNDFYSSGKDLPYISNADLYQAVGLSKAEVVKRGLGQEGRTLDLEQPDAPHGLTLLMKATQKGNLAIVEMLLENGAQVNAQQANGATALMMAAEQNNVCLVTLLLKYGANSSLYTINSDVAETALTKAIKRQNKEVVNLMLRVGVNISAPTCNGISALDMAIDRRNPQIEALVRAHMDRLRGAFESRVLSTLEDTAQLMEQLFPLQCFPLREAQAFTVQFNSNIQPVPSGEGFLLFIAHTKINDKGVRCRFHGSCPIASVKLNGVEQSPLTKEVNFVTSCHPIITGCNTLVISKLPDYTSKAKLLVCAYRARLIC